MLYVRPKNNRTIPVCPRNRQCQQICPGYAIAKKKAMSARALSACKTWLETA